MRHALLISATVLLVLFTGCTDDARMPRGVMFNSDGLPVANTAYNYRKDREAVIVRQLDDQFKPHWRSEAKLAELPAMDASADADWEWTAATLTVTMIGDGQAPLPETEAAIQQAVVDFMRPQMRRPAKPQVTVASITDPVRFAARPAAAAAPAAVPVVVVATSASASAPGPRAYEIQAGDTLAEISAVFYGTPKRWRDIVAANPGLDPAALTPGTRIILP